MHLTTRLRPPLSRLHAKLFRRSLQDFAVETVELSPATPRRLPPAITLPDMADRIRGFDEMTTRAIQEGWFLSEQDLNGPTRAFLLSDALVIPSGIYGSRGRGSVTLRPGASRGPVRGPILQVESGQLCTNRVIETYFGHWLSDGLPGEILAAERGLAPITLKRTPWLHEPGYRELSGLDPVPVEQALFRKLWIPHDLALNDGRIARMQQIRERIRRAVPQDGPEHVFLHRGQSGAARRLINEDEVRAALLARGFTVLEPEKLRPAEIARGLARARTVVAIEGSAVLHAYASMPEGGAAVIIQPPFRFNAIYRPLAASVGHHYACVIADPHPEGFVLPVDDLLATLDMTDRIQALGTRAGTG